MYGNDRTITKTYNILTVTRLSLEGLQVSPTIHYVCFITSNVNILYTIDTPQFNVAYE